jgi:hypothetical protein
MSDLEFLGKVKGMKTFKQFQQERLLKATVITATELTKRKEEVEERAKSFARAAADQEFVNRTERSERSDCPISIKQRAEVMTREPFEEQP